MFSLYLAFAIVVVVLSQAEPIPVQHERLIRRCDNDTISPGHASPPPYYPYGWTTSTSIAGPTAGTPTLNSSQFAPTGTTPISLFPITTNSTTGGAVQTSAPTAANSSVVLGSGSGRPSLRPTGHGTFSISSYTYQPTFSYGSYTPHPSATVPGPPGPPTPGTSSTVLGPIGTGNLPLSSLNSSPFTFNSSLFGPDVTSTTTIGGSARTIIISPGESSHQPVPCYGSGYNCYYSSLSNAGPFPTGLGSAPGSIGMGTGTGTFPLSTGTSNSSTANSTVLSATDTATSSSSIITGSLPIPPFANSTFPTSTCNDSSILGPTAPLTTVPTTFSFITSGTYILVPEINTSGLSAPEASAEVQTEEDWLGKFIDSLNAAAAEETSEGQKSKKW